MLKIRPRKKTGTLLFLELLWYCLCLWLRGKWPRFVPIWPVIALVWDDTSRIGTNTPKFVRGQKLNTNFFFLKFFGRRRDIPAKSRDIPPRNLISLVSRVQIRVGLELAENRNPVGSATLFALPLILSLVARQVASHKMENGPNLKATLRARTKPRDLQLWGGNLRPRTKLGQMGSYANVGRTDLPGF